MSYNYYKENCTIIPQAKDGTIYAIRIIPDNGYVLRRAKTIEGGETEYTYISGYMEIPTSQVEEVLPTIEAIPENEIESIESEEVGE